MLTYKEFQSKQKRKTMLGILVRALRLPFLSASILPYMFGSLIRRENFNIAAFLLGLATVISTHLSSNLINDYADSKSGVDWKDMRFFGLFGGSKLIQHGILRESFYLRLAVFFAIIGFVSVFALSFAIRSWYPLALFPPIIISGWLYSRGPCNFSYHYLGEPLIWLLFGPALVMGGYFMQTGIFPDARSFLLSLPFGFFTCAILYANEIPDFSEDVSAGKFTWVKITGLSKAYILYGVIEACAFLSIIAAVLTRSMNSVSLLSLIFVVPVLRALFILKKYPADKERLVRSSGLTIATQAFVSLTLIAGALL